MKVKVIVFSPTGGTGKAANILAKALSSDVKTIDISVSVPNTEIAADDLCIIAAPSFTGRLPIPCAQRLAAMKGNGAKAVLMVVYGNREYEDTLVELEDVAVAAGFKPMAAVAAIAQHSVATKVAAGRPNNDDAEVLKSFAKEIAEAYAAGKENAPAIPGNRPYRDLASLPVVPLGDGNCISCGACARQCPAGAINPETPKETDADKCILCMRCVKICPMEARTVNPAVIAGLSAKLEAGCAEPKKNQLFI